MPSFSGNFISYIIGRDIYPLVDPLLRNLTASDVLSLLEAIGMQDSFRYRVRYLNPLRNIEPTMYYMNMLMERSHTMLILGSDVREFLYNATHPTRRTQEDRPEVWLACIPKDKDSLLAELKSARVRCSIHNDAASQTEEYIEAMRHIGSNAYMLYDDDGFPALFTEEEYAAPLDMLIVGVQPRGGFAVMAMDNLAMLRIWRKMYPHTERRSIPYINAGRNSFLIRHTISCPMNTDGRVASIPVRRGTWKTTYIPISLR